MNKLKVIDSQKRLCYDCMEEHIVKIVLVSKCEIYKEKEVNYESILYYCENDNSFLADEDMMKKNNLTMKDTYRNLVGLLDSVEIKKIRAKYDISAKDLAKVLGWGC